MWLPQGGALKIENLQFTQYSTCIIMLLSSSTPSLISACFFTVGIQAQPLTFEILLYI